MKQPSFFSGVPSRTAPAAETVMALDLGMYNMKDFPFVREGIPGGTTLHGLQIMQLLPSHIAPRAYYFGALKHGQVSFLLAQEHAVDTVQALRIACSRWATI